MTRRLASGDMSILPLALIFILILVPICEVHNGTRKDTVRRDMREKSTEKALLLSFPHSQMIKSNKTPNRDIDSALSNGLLGIVYCV